MLVVLVGGIPIAMPTVLSVTLALGAYKLAKEGAIVARMSAVEEMAGELVAELWACQHLFLLEGKGGTGLIGDWEGRKPGPHVPCGASCLAADRHLDLPLRLLLRRHGRAVLG